MSDGNTSGVAPGSVAGVRAPYRPPRRHTARRGAIFWPIAAGEVVLAIALALVLPRLEAHYHWRDGITYDSATAQAMLGAIAGGMITLTGFVLTAVTLMVQTVQSQSSRLLQVMNRTDRTPLLFGTLTATFTFALLILSEVHEDRVPDISVTLALVMVLGCTVQFLRMLVTFRTALTVSGLTRGVGTDVRRLIGAIYPVAYVAGPAGDGGSGPLAGQPPAWTVRHAGQPGVFQSFDEVAAVKLAAAAGATIRFVPAAGDFLVTGAVLADGTGPVPDAGAVRKLCRIGPNRTLEQDPGYGLRMLADIAIRALSPAVNDPTSAVQSLDQIDDILHRLAGRSLGDGLLHDPGGRVVVRYPAPTWPAFLSLAVDEIIQYGAGSLQVARRLRAMLDDLLASAPDPRRAAIRGKLAVLNRAVRRAFPDAEEAAEAAEPDRQGIGSPREP